MGSLCGFFQRPEIIQNRDKDLGFPRPQTRHRIPISWKRGSRGPKTPISPWAGKGSFLSKNPPFFYKGTQGKWGFFDRKLHLSCEGEGKWGFFGPRDPLFKEMGIRALSGVGRIPNKDDIVKL